ncbi:MAG: hypothetical protein P8H13_09925 [Polaribacter sp.]|nr:hypothetical protein [Polaribacter sp.]MDG1812240.1 hypothetical protein [Polaribacter sp.]MDG1993786.1 hypothetical protein [Polaribacter sp.]
MTPSIIQLAHTLENHKHVVCISDDVTHVHEKNIDCSLLHRQLQTNNIDFTSNFDVIPQHFYTNIFKEYPQVKRVKIVSKKTSRGPPFFIV